MQATQSIWYWTSPVRNTHMRREKEGEGERERFTGVDSNILHGNSIAQGGKLNDLFRSLWHTQYGVQFIKISSKFEHERTLDSKSQPVFSLSLFCVVVDDSIYIYTLKIIDIYATIKNRLIIHYFVHHNFSISQIKMSQQHELIKIYIVYIFYHWLEFSSKKEKKSVTPL